MNTTTAIIVTTNGAFTAHKIGCAHLHLGGSETGETLEIAGSTRSELRADLDEQGFEDSGLDYAPCLRGVPNA